jgi:hypothetical protein
MKATFIITDDNGNTWSFELPLSNCSIPSNSSFVQRKRQVKDASPVEKEPQRANKDLPLDLSLPIRPFIKRHAREASGPQKFTLLVAHVAGGDLGIEVPRGEIEKQWNKMTGLMGGEFNAAYSSRARDNGWVDSPKFGVYKLLPGWKGVL